MDKVNELRDSARSILATANEAIQSGDIEAASKARQDAVEQMEKAEQIQNEADALKTLSGDWNKPTNSVPVTGEEAKIYNATDKGSAYRNDYKPATWVKGLPAAVQPTWVRDQMGAKTRRASTQTLGQSGSVTARLTLQNSFRLHQPMN